MYDNVYSVLLNLRNDLKIEIEDQEISRSVRNYKKELMDATVMVIKHSIEEEHMKNKDLRHEQNS